MSFILEYIRDLKATDWQNKPADALEARPLTPVVAGIIFYDLHLYAAEDKCI